jgi:hypothetical protein
MDGNECCTSSPITRQKLTFIFILVMLLHDNVYMQMRILKRDWEFKSKSIYNPATDSVREGKYCRDNQSIHVQRQENAEVWLPELISTS